MCKILTLVGVPKKNMQTAWKFIEASRQFMCVNDNDGYGYAAVSGKDSLYGERWLRPVEAYRVRPPSKADHPKLLKASAGLDLAKDYSKFGQVSLDFTTITTHARMATCGVSIENTHPFVDGHTSVIHNGVISNIKDFPGNKSTCDSECILQAYNISNVSREPGNITRAAHALEGWYACAVLTKDDTGRKVLDIFRNEGASLFSAYIEELDCLVFCTTKEILMRTCYETEMTHGRIVAVKAGLMMRFDAVTGDPLKVYAFDPEYDAWSNWRNYDKQLVKIGGKTVDIEDYTDPYYSSG